MDFEWRRREQTKTYSFLCTVDSFDCHFSSYAIFHDSAVEAAGLLEDHDRTKTSTVWLLKEGTDDLLLYAVYLKSSDNLVFRLFTLKKKSIKKIEIIDNSFVFKYK
jgi:hypothetical protein